MAPKVDLESHKDLILTLYRDKRPLATILDELQQHGVTVLAPTLRRRIREWGVPANTKPQHDASIKARFMVLYREGLRDKNILEKLQEEGYSLSLRTLRRIRHDQLGIPRRVNNPDDPGSQNRETVSSLRKQHQETLSSLRKETESSDDMTEPIHSSIFEKAIAVTPINANTYSAYLDPAWCIGKVLHGGYIATVLYRAGATHFARKATKRVRRGRPSEPIGLQTTFQRRTFSGPALLTVQEIKLGARISTIHVTLSQASNENVAPLNAQNMNENELEVKVLAYINLSPPDAEEDTAVQGLAGDHFSAPAPGSLPGGLIDFEALAKNGIDGEWRSGPRAPPAITVGKHIKSYSPSSLFRPKTVEERARQAVDQWAQFTPGGRPARWSNEAVVWLADIFLVALDRMGAMEEMRLANGVNASARSRKNAAENVSTDASLGLGRFWYPTATMNIDLKTRLPREGVEWLHSHVVTRMIRGGRYDLEILIRDQKGELVATSTQVGLVVDSARNTKGRQDTGRL